MIIDKSQLRQQLHLLRNNLEHQTKITFSLSICKQILSHDIFKHSKNIALYSALGNEVDLSELYNSHLNKVTYLPVIGKNNSMDFKQYHDSMHLTQNQYGILEPLEGEIIKAENIDLCLVPLLGFNRQGQRLGMGGGYYDRYFEKNKFQKKPTILAGVAYDFQENDTICSESWDIPLDLIFTNKEVITP